MKTEYTILLCDDDEFLIRLYTYKLEFEGFKVVEIRSGDLVVAQMKEVMPSLVILDLILPNKTGFEVLQELNTEENLFLRNIPIIVSSNLSQQSDIDTVKSLGAVDFLVKSRITPNDLVDRIRCYLPHCLPN
ncbi:hypothetical protein A3I99_00190 [Candidatus Kaiserbacteria bacterium RIFCSPLOWO2_02_FULL_45_11b]|uniref:Response regulatory domain-containing protein n=1 Tax=Candidatus Kaiserbacteria bacterium RIFCSPLOWO2_12_FULL_45_26 TaxID=1798525 RepID=A0A1F6FGG2_9BACT|nr:MAG: hypothetical protein A2Z56_00515 [Candidatus Kaiserbacteria bacterium RIFCSPHIGHO2_12_45_16]OGG71016.1 MAG: hypothetical protein A2929_01650 [Candidatus Kaiserbacteria bacterium RIFCSPLOWO2_01_FULL_45_25]OGG84205.1 MAG: hypothetical protein A3I99_00190 [Candidatus Kaiserbacteria bacterium RIFCSPLOWO2_02_FULL_45_11b]OGG84942.1 MAG: hypothetical protein A3G90_02640 [Candidatus Kaiserbacteria bacterium RIFCSPLOWO2_12_FULL_45_26]